MRFRRLETMRHALQTGVTVVQSSNLPPAAPSQPARGCLSLPICKKLPLPSDLQEAVSPSRPARGCLSIPTCKRLFLPSDLQEAFSPSRPARGCLSIPTCKRLGLGRNDVSFPNQYLSLRKLGLRKKNAALTRFNCIAEN
ncbi:hypothetical protein Bpfe_009234 [Biomphalaria pfeifferi]|uniref:Uncharacterized protein n=1 Tax=Biomphalaria pfeifferi TaxID=112525 RepID=A0AAD8FF01_BIOPF|nr:hypothetical protein Bpfe_009234 [Biomphalaria pfeifferi]